MIAFYGALGCCHYYTFGTSASTLELLKRMKEIADVESGQDLTKHHEIVLIYDQESIPYVSNDNNAMLLEFFRVTDLGRIGAPVDYYSTMI